MAAGVPLGPPAGHSGQLSTWEIPEDSKGQPSQQCWTAPWTLGRGGNRGPTPQVSSPTQEGGTQILANGPTAPWETTPERNGEPGPGDTQVTEGAVVEGAGLCSWGLSPTAVSLSSMPPSPAPQAGPRGLISGRRGQRWGLWFGAQLINRLPSLLTCPQLSLCVGP